MARLLVMRRLYCVTQGRSNRWLVRRLGKRAVASSGPSTQGQLSEMPEHELDGIVNDIKRDGYRVLGQRLSERDVESLVSFAGSIPARPIPSPSGGPLDARYEAGKPLAIKYNLPEHALVEHPVIQRLLADSSLRELARRYLGCEPVNDLVAMWWSTAFSCEASSEVAQLYHFDMDRPQFLKLFFYLTDVSEENGPHCYIRGSHRERPPSLWRDGRHGDGEILAQYGSESEVEITAPRGTALWFAVDTSGFHKGKPLRAGHRLILQFQYTSVLFGQRYTTMRVPQTEFWREQLLADRRYLSRFSLA